MDKTKEIPDIYCEKLPSYRYATFQPTNTGGACPSTSSPSMKEEHQIQTICDEFCDETSDEIVAYKNVTVKFRISQTDVIAQVYPNRLTIADVKKDIARRFEVKPDIVCFKQCGLPLSDECMLYETDKDDFGIHEFALAVEPMSSDSETQLAQLDLNKYYDKHRLADFIIVHIAGEHTVNGSPKDIVVEIENKAIIKPFLCGYRNKLTGVEYLDAFTQTGPYFDKWKHRRYFSRDTQTFHHKEKFIDTMHDQSSQCFLDGNNVLLVAAATDFTIVPRKYQTYAQKTRRENKLAKIILIQRNWRRFLLVRTMKRCAAEYRRQVENRRIAEEKFQATKLKRISRENRCKQFPRTKNDFDLLYAEVHNWKVAELKRIAARYDGAARVVEVNILLDKEIQMLNAVNRQQKLVYDAMEDFRTEQLLTKLGSPIKWIGYKDKIIHMDLLRAQRVRFLTEIYKDLKKKLNKTERLELICKVKEILVLQEQNFPAFADLYELFDREKVLLMYATYCDLSVLRKRQLLIFLDLIKWTEEEVKVEKAPKRLCEVCQQVRTYDEFAVRTRQNIVDTCKKCYALSNCSADNSVYAAILRQIQREERKKHCNASFAFVLQLDDIRYIIEKIWHSHSILSKNDDLRCLRLPRWIKSDDWSPWNCVCLTEDEVQDHYNVNDLNKVYSKKLRLAVANRHMLARNAFHQLAQVSTEFNESRQWYRVGMNPYREVKLFNIFGGATRKPARKSSQARQ